MRYLVLVNPLSHGGRAGRRWREFAQLLPDAEFIELKSVDEGRDLARTASNCETVVACGGDGTINAIADGVMSNPDASLKFGVIYQGTSPDFCRFHGIPTEPRAACELLQTGTVRPIPVLQANGHCFFCSCNLGIGAMVASRANRLRPVLGDTIGTLLALLSALLNSPSYDLTVNGETLSHCGHLLITRMPYIASGLKVSLPPLADDELAVWSVKSMTLFRWLALLPKLYRGESCGEFQIFRSDCRISSSEAVSVEYDGDPHGSLPLEISFAPRRLNLIVPKDVAHGS